MSSTPPSRAATPPSPPRSTAPRSAHGATTIAASGSAAGVRGTITPGVTSGIVVAGDYIELASDGAPSSVSPVTWTIVVRAG